MLSMACNTPKKADLILFNGKIYTLANDSATCSAIVMADGKIIATGNDQLKEAYEAKEEINLAGRAVYPGFIDAHCHFTEYGLDKYKCKLFFTTSFEEVLERIKEYDKTNNYSWIYGRGWDQNDWDIKEFPNNSILNELYPDKPVILKRIDGHAMLVNTKALALAGITIDTKIDGGIMPWIPWKI